MVAAIRCVYTETQPNVLIRWFFGQRVLAVLAGTLFREWCGREIRRIDMGAALDHRSNGSLGLKKGSPLGGCAAVHEYMLASLQQNEAGIRG